MYGSVLGNIAGVGYFLAYQVAGILIAFKFFAKEKISYRILTGSVIGSFALSWLPVLSAVFLGFSVRAHIVALIVLVAICFFYLTESSDKDSKKRTKQAWSIKSIFTDHPVLVVVIPLFLLIVIILLHHTISEVDGAMHAGQSTYGDMNMHLGFITSIARQGEFPPEYSILPGTVLAYPFLSDSISSSVYIWGSSLRIAYILPMVFALLQVFFGFVSVAEQLLSGAKRRGVKVLLAFALFFFNGGLGIWYFIHPATASNFTRIFTEFYQTPTNLVDKNIYWHNIICDMLIPQRATLFGWAMLFTIISMLIRARGIDGGKTRMAYYAFAGVLAGGLPLIHTHSFLALGVLCAGTLCIELYDLDRSEVGSKLIKNQVKSEKTWAIGWKSRLVLIAGLLFVLTMISLSQKSEQPLTDTVLLVIGLGIVVVFGIYFVTLIVKNTIKQDNKIWIYDILKSWGIFLIVVLVLALPQLVNFTFKQAQGEQFVRGAFNWANNNPDIMDSYIVFYLKNIGIVFVLLICMIVTGTRRQVRMILPAGLLWMICEFILFQPNPYDNNKLLLVGYMFICIAVADYACETLPDKLVKLIKKDGSQRIHKAITSAVICIVAVVGCISAALSVGREYVSDYELYGSDYVRLAQWVEENTDPSDIFLTATNHNNAIASLTGRNIVCGAGTFLYYHGLDYGTQENDVRTMYEDPSVRDELLDDYQVDYIVVGGVELGSYAISDLDEMYEMYDVVYSSDGVVVFEV